MWLYAACFHPAAIMSWNMVDEEGWPHYRQLKPLPVFSLIEQENFMKDHILLYFENQDAND